MEFSIRKRVTSQGKAKKATLSILFRRIKVWFNISTTLEGTKLLLMANNM